MIKVGLLLDTPSHGGGAFQYSQSMLQALRSLPSTAFQILVVFTHDDWEAQLRNSRTEYHRIRMASRHRWLQRVWNAFSLPIWPWRKMLFRLHPLSRALVELDCDVWLFPSQDLWGAWSPVNAINTVHDLMHRYESRFPEVGRTDIRWRRDHRYRAICRYSQAILTDSEVGRQHVIESYGPPAGRVRVLPYVAPPAIAAAGADDIDVRDRYQLPEKYIFYPAQLWQHKNHVNLLHAVAALRPELPDIALVLVGSHKNASDTLDRLIAELGLETCVRWHGYVPEKDMPGLYRNARALVMPSFFGPTNIPALEAMTLGCPAAVSGIYAMPEQLGDAAIYFDPNSIASISDAVRLMWTDDEMIAKLRSRHARCLESHSPERFASCLEQILRDSVPNVGADI